MTAPTCAVRCGAAADRKCGCTWDRPAARIPSAYPIKQCCALIPAKCLHNIDPYADCRSTDRAEWRVSWYLVGSCTGRSVRYFRLSWRDGQWRPSTHAPAKENPSVDLISSVILSALQWKRVNPALMDSGWTKLAAFSTDWLEGTDRTPQVIYDSRVANALIRNVEKLIKGGDNDWLLGLLPTLQRHLRTVPGRGGSRGQPYQLRWKSGYGRWDAHLRALL